MCCLSTFSRNSRFLIDRNIELFLYALLKNMFLKTSKEQKNKIEKTLNIWLDKINKNIIKTKEKYLNLEYSTVNLNNIIIFVKSQNYLYAAEILENILIKIFADTMQVSQDELINSYIYNNFIKIRNDDKYLSWFSQKKLKPKELNDIKLFLSNNNNIIFYQNSPFVNYLYNIIKEKYNPLNFEKNNTLGYIYNECLPNQKQNEKYFLQIKNNNNGNNWNTDMISNSLMNIKLELEKDAICDKALSIEIIKRFLYSVFIYYQTKNSPLIKNNSVGGGKYGEMVHVPYAYDFRGAYVEGRFANSLISTLRIENRIENILFGQNNFREIGMYELGKSLVFNKNIKSINLNNNLLRSDFLDYFFFGMGSYNNYSVEEINLAYNNLKSESETNLIRIIERCQGLKTLILNGNKLKYGFGGFFAILKKYYQQKKTKIETLMINNCELSDDSFIELGELLKCKFCSLQKLYLIGNNFDKYTAFLKKIKFNKNLKEFYIGKNNINNEDDEDINRIISNTKINQLYLFQTEMNNFKNCLNVIYRARIVKNNKEKKNKKIFIDKDNATLKSLDMSRIELEIKNINYIQLLQKISEESSLTIFDFSRILFGKIPQKYEKISDNKNYWNVVENLSTKLFKEKSKYNDLINEKRKAEVDIKRLCDGQNFDDFIIFKNIEKKIKKVIKDKRAIYPLYLQEEAKKIIQEENIINIKSDENNDNDNEELEGKLVNYMKIINTKNKLNQLDNIKKQQKFFIF